MVTESDTKKYTIGVGGIITAILEEGGIDLSRYTPVEGTTSLSLEALRLSRVINGVDNDTNKIVYNIRVSPTQKANILLPSKNLKPLRKVGPNLMPQPEELQEDDQIRKVKGKGRQSEVEAEIQEEEAPRTHPATGLPILPQQLQTPNEKWLYQNLVKVHKRNEEVNKRNEELNKKVKKHGKAISTLMRIVKRLTPKSFRSRSRNEDDQPMEEVDEIDEFLEDYDEGDHVMHMQEDEPQEDFQRYSPIRHSFHVGDSTMTNSPPNEPPRRHSIHEEPAFTLDHVEEAQVANVQPEKNLCGAKYSRRKKKRSTHIPSP